MNIEEIFSEAVNIATPVDRAAYLDKVCAGDTALRTRLEALLTAHHRAASFLDTAAEQRPAEMHRPGSGPNADATPPPAAYRAITEQPGSMIGRYKLLQQIGEGGMGVVYMAEQEKPVRRRAALKIIKPGMDSSQVIARFEAERQALAMMDHPNIARVLDAGCTETGRPYFVMELVQGITITKYCDDKQLTTRERLELFIPVCQAVQHAHQKGIIHRDLKPSNVLVTIYDGKPIPKIIDFGVAKALHQQLTEKTMFTQYGAVVGTLEYMSPEQAEMDALGTDTRSDIYSLGVLLYELLTGTTPIDGKKLRSLGYAEMLKTIREVDPPRPSTRLTQSKQDMGTISAQRHTEPRRLQKMVAGDLDWIVMKCLEKDRTRRYETANGLALDIQRHLQDEAVSASPPSQLYKFRKLVRRNKLACAAVASVMLALVLGLAASLWQAKRAQREAARASLAEHEALTTLDDLRAAAPSIAAEARALAAQEQFDQAIGKLDYAAKLRPDVPDYLLDKADLLETQLRLAGAAGVYRAALKLKPDDARAKANAELCDQLVAATKTTDGKLTRESLSKLDAQMAKDQRPAAEIMPVARLLGDEKKYIVNYWLDRLRDLPNGTDTPLEKRLTVGEGGLLDLDLEDTQIADLSPLAGMPLGALRISKCMQVIDLSPLRGMPLATMDLSGTGVTSLEPLRGMRSLEKLLLDDTKVSDLSPLAGLPLTWLEVGNCPVTSLAPLQGMPLERLVARSTGVTDLSPLAGMPLKKLDLSLNPITDFTPLSGLPLETVLLGGVRIGDLGFLERMPLKQLALIDAVGARHLAVLSDIQTLQVLALPDNLSGLSDEDFAAVEKLRDHPSLKQLSARVPINVNVANLPSKDVFWKNWDRDYAWAMRLRKAGLIFNCNRLEDGTWALICQNQPLPDLSILGGAAISHLNLNGARINDLTPLRSLPLSWLELENTPARDLTPLRGLKLTYLGLYGTAVHDLSPLRGMPLKNLDLRASTNTDVSVVLDVSPLLDVPTLESVALPIQAINIESLRKLPTLNRLAFSYDQSAGRPVCTAEEFWKTWDGLLWAQKLNAVGIAFGIKQLPGGFYFAQVNDPKFTDCSIFKGSSIRQLNLDSCGVTDLSPLADVPLESLSLRASRVTDLSPLRSPVLHDSLRKLFLWKTRVVNFSPIADCRNLELLDFSDTALGDLSIVEGMKLRVLNVAHTNVTDIAPLAGMPLEQVYLGGTKVTDLSPLLKCPTLYLLLLPEDARNIESLHALPNLASISFHAANGGLPDKTADQFWKDYNAKTR